MKRSDSRYLTIEDVAKETGLSEAFWRKAILHRRIAYAKLGRRVMIRRCDLQNWIAERIVRAGGPIRSDRSSSDFDARSASARV